MNQEIKDFAKKRGVRLWQLADAVGMTDVQLSKKFRYELPEDFKKVLFEKIEELASKKEV